MPDELELLHEQGFDLSREAAGGCVRVRCSQCAACCVNGVACHETGCPNGRASGDG